LKVLQELQIPVVAVVAAEMLLAEQVDQELLLCVIDTSK
jgi:hypothetical protein